LNVITVFVLFIRHAKRMRLIILSSVPVWLYLFDTLSHKRHDLPEEVTEI